MNARTEEEVLDEGRDVSAETGMVALIAGAEIDQQIATAHKYPRSISTFRKEALAMVTLSEVIAQECIYALPRDGKVIQGPSARFAEIMLHAWGNSRAGARVVHEDQEFITSQGVCHDLQRNVAITFEVRRRITTNKGKRFGADMIGVTANAASSIALRNSILKVVPKAFWSELYTAALMSAVGDVKTLANKRADAIAAFQHYGISEAQIVAKLGRAGVQDITLDDLALLFGIHTAIKESEITPEEAFSVDGAIRPATVQAPQSKSATSTPTEAQKPSEPAAKTGEHIPAGAVDETANTTAASAGQIKLIRTKASVATITEDEILKEFGLTTLEGISVLTGNCILKFIEDPAGYRGKAVPA